VGGLAAAPEEAGLESAQSQSMGKMAPIADLSVAQEAVAGAVLVIVVRQVSAMACSRQSPEARSDPMQPLLVSRRPRPTQMIEPECGFPP